MFTLLFLAIVFAFGLAAISQLKLELEGTEKFFLSLSIGILLAVPLTYACSLLFLKLLPGILFSTLVMLVLVVLSAQHQRFDWKFKFDNLSVAFALAALIVMALLIKSSMLDMNAKGEVLSGPSSYGDASYHAIVVNSFALADNLPPQEPIFAGTPISYHFFADFLSAIFVMLGLDFRVAIQFGNVLFATCLLFFIYALGLRLFGSRKVGAFACLFIVFSGGLGFLEAYATYSQSGASPLAFLASIHTDYSYFDHSGGLANMFETGFCAARAVISGFAPALACIFILCIALKEDRKDLLLPIGFFVGLLPMFLIYSFISMGVFIVVTVLTFKGKAWLRELALFSAIAVLLALPMVVPAAAGFASSGAVRLNLGWEEQSIEPLTTSLGMPIHDYPVIPILNYSFEGLDRFLAFWARNFGFFGLLLLGGIAIASPFNKRFFVGALAIFVMANVIQFQPYEFDNIKFFYFFLLFASLFAADALRRIWEENNFLIPLAILFLLLSTATGALSVLFNLDTKYVNYNPTDYYIGQWVQDNTPRKAIFLTSDYATHPVPNIAGRLVIQGYRGWVWTRALDVSTRDQAIRDIYSGSNPSLVASRLDEYKIDYVFIGPSERGSQLFTVNESFFDSSPLYTKVFERSFSFWERYTIYKVNR